MNLTLTFVIHFLTVISISVIKVDGLRCYVCGDDGEVPCKDFDLKKHIYIRNCSDTDHKGCEAHTEVSTTTRKCSSNSFNDCKLANGVEHCYCVTDLCNGNISELIGTTDDEDLVEGSGTTTASSETEKSVVTKKKSLGTKVDLYCSLILIPFVVIFYNN